LVGSPVVEDLKAIDDDRRGRYSPMNSAVLPSLDCLGVESPDV